jgi:hypothetical protein
MRLFYFILILLHFLNFAFKPFNADLSLTLILTHFGDHLWSNQAPGELSYEKTFDRMHYLSPISSYP